MTDDFGDDSGEKLVDWMIRIGQDAGEAAMMASGERLASAFRRARGVPVRAARQAALPVNAFSRVRTFSCRLR